MMKDGTVKLMVVLIFIESRKSIFDKNSDKIVHDKIFTILSQAKFSQTFKI